jgi:predicted lipase
MDQYRDYVNSAILANFSYNNSDSLIDLWIKTRDSNKENLSNVFSCVKEVPEFYNNNETGAYGFSFLKEKTLYFVFRGTNDYQDVIADLNFILVPFDEGNKKCKVHQGFMTQFSVFKDSVLRTILEHKKDIEIIKFIGHSLGGALATLFTGYVANLHSELKVVCHTFGSPRVGNKNYAKWFQKNVCSSNCIRIMNQNDPVAQIPISAFFQHVSNTKCIMDDLTVKDLPDRSFWSRLVNFKINCCKPVLAHSCEKYIEVLTKLYEKDMTMSIRV